MASAETIRDMQPVQRIPVEELPKHLATLEAELADGRSIVLMRGETVVTELRGKETVSETASGLWRAPDFEGQMREVYGDVVFPAGTTLAWINEDRGPK